MDEIKLTISLSTDPFVICRLSPTAEIPDQITNSSFFSITRTAEELSIVYMEGIAPKEGECDYGWRCFKVKGPLDFSLIGIIASIATALARAGVSIFTLSTFNTDYFLVKDEKIDVAVKALREAGHIVENSSFG